MVASSFGHRLGPLAAQGGDLLLRLADGLPGAGHRGLGGAAQALDLGPAALQGQKARLALEALLQEPLDGRDLLLDQHELALGTADLGLVAGDLGLALPDALAQDRLLVGQRPGPAGEPLHLALEQAGQCPDRPWPPGVPRGSGPRLPRPARP